MSDERLTSEPDASDSFSASFRSLVFSPRRTWAVRDDLLVKDGRVKADLSQVTRCSVQLVYAKRRRTAISVRVTIETPQGKVRIISTAATFGANRHQTEMRRFCTLLLQHIAARSPNAAFRTRGPWVEFRWRPVTVRGAVHAIQHGARAPRAERRREERRRTQR